VPIVTGTLTVMAAAATGAGVAALGSGGAACVLRDRPSTRHLASIKMRRGGAGELHAAALSGSASAVLITRANS
jgi:hypothetical protein